jgi:hypothetical protein
MILVEERGANDRWAPSSQEGAGEAAVARDSLS